MSYKCCVYLAVICLLSVAITSPCWISQAIAAEYLEEFDTNNLDANLWEMKAEGDASYEIVDGQLIMTSPEDPDGILLYWRGSDIVEEDFTVEISATVAPNTENAGVIAFIKEDLPPTLNTTINSAWKLMFWCGANTSGWYINDDTWSRTGAEGPEFEGVWKAEIIGGEISCYYNDEEVVVVDKIQEDRFVCFGPDTYTSHYSGEMTIDWIRLSGPSVPATAVEPSEKLSTMWGAVKHF